ncbi:MAG: hypothetical protein ACKKMP_00105 [Candidatus Nealsonbacteria bacterium]
MKKIITFLLVFILITSVAPIVGAQSSHEQEAGNGNSESGQEGQDTDQGQQIQTEQETQDQEEEENIMVQQKEQLKAGTALELKNMIQEKQQEMNQEIQQLKKQQQEVYQNQNQVKLAVHSLLAMEDLVGGIGPKLSQIAREFDNSVQATIEKEEKIQTKNSIIKFFIGGDKESAEFIEQEVEQNLERIQELKLLKESCDCEAEVETLLQEQIDNIESEQNRLKGLAQAEKQIKGIFERLFSWFRR